MDQETLDLLKKFKEGLEGTPEDFAELEKRLTKYNASLKSQQTIFQSFGNVFKGYTKEHLQTMETFDAAIEETKKNVKKLNEVEVDAHVRKLEALKAEGLLTATKNRAAIAARGFGKGLLETTNQVATAAISFVQDLQSNREGTEIFGAANIKAAKAIGKTVESVASLTQTIGMILTLFPAGRILKWVGVGLTALGTGVELLAPKLTELAEKGIETLNTEVEKTKKGFRDISSTGAYFTNGMEEMRVTAGQAGLDIMSLGEIARGRGDDLAKLGLGVNEGIKRFAGINAEIKNGKLALQFRALGMDTKAYGEAAIEAAGILNEAGRLAGMDNAQVAQFTMEYVKNLKILSNLTGEDAKKKMEKARKDSMEADLYARAMNEGGMEAVVRLQNVLANTPESMQTAMMQYISTGGRAVTDIASRVLMARNPEMEKLLAAGLDNVKAQGRSATAVTQSMQEQLQRTTNDALKNYKELGNIAAAGRLTGTALLNEVAALQKDLLTMGLKLKGVDISKEILDINKTLEGTGGKLTTTISKIDEAADELKALLGVKLTGALDSYVTQTLRAVNIAKQLNDSYEGVAEGLNKSKEDADKVQQKPTATTKSKNLFGESDFAKMMESDGAWATDIFGLNKLFGGKSDSEGETRGKAKGGISTGPVSGYQEILHGTEAVVPLPDNKTIPVTLNTGALTTSIERNNSLLTDILRVLKEGNNLSSHIARSVA